MLLAERILIKNFYVTSRGEKIAYLRDSIGPNGWSQTDLAVALASTQLLGLDMKKWRSRIANYETGRSDASDKVVSAISEFFGLPKEWFSDGKDLDKSPVPKMKAQILTQQGSANVSIPPGASPPAPGLEAGRTAQPEVGRRKFPLLGIVGASSFPLPSPEMDPDDYVEFSDELFRADRYAIQVRGDSMHPRLEHGDFVLVQPAKDVIPGTLVVARNEQYEYIVKLAKRQGSSIELHPLNADYEIIIPGDGWTIEGFAVAYRRERGRGRYLEEADVAGLRP